ALGHRARRLPLIRCALDDLVVDVGEVLDEGHPEPFAPEVAIDDVEHDRAARVADVAEVVHGDPAHVDPHLARPDRDEVLLPAGERVVDPKRHQDTSRVTTAIAAMPSSRPTRPRCSGLLALTLTQSDAAPSVSASRRAISASRGPRRGAWQITVASRLTRRAPRAATRSITDPTRTTLH